MEIMGKIDEIKKLMALVQEYELEYPNLVFDLPFDELATVYNGCGPDWLPETIRRLLTRFYSIFAPAFLIHDVRFHFSDKTKKGFKQANNEMFRNCRKIVGKTYSWFLNPGDKARWYVRAWYVWRACVRFGWSAWLDG
jgi:hypothetical protein